MVEEALQRLDMEQGEEATTVAAAVEEEALQRLDEERREEAAAGHIPPTNMD